MSLTYATWVSAVQNLCAESDPPSAGFTSILPNAIDDGEQRLYRSLDLLATVTVDNSATLTPNNRNFTLPQANGRFVATEQINVFDASSVRYPLTPASKETVDFLWPSDTASSASAIPQLYAPVTDQLFRLGPAPGSAWSVEVIGTIRPAPLSATNTTTFLTLYLPDLFVAATMIFLSGWQMNFGSQADDPKMAVSWESHYNNLFASANLEEIRKKYGAAGWQSQSVANVAPSRSA